MTPLKKIWGLTLMLLVLFLVSCRESPIGYTGDYFGPGENTNKTLRIVGNWTKTGIGTHFASGPDAGPAVIYALEGCMQYVRTTDIFYYLLAEDFIHANDSLTDDVLPGESVIVVRDDAKWHDGTKVTAIDILSYYVLCYTDFTNYVYDLYVIDDNNNGDLTDDLRLKVVWKSWKEPTDYAKNILLAMDTKNGTIQYKTFKPFVDASLDLIFNGINGIPNERVTEKTDGIGEIRLGRHANAISGELGAIYNNFRAYVASGEYPHNYIGTGPFKIQSVTENQMVLIKNEDYYFADKIGFDKIIATQYSNSNMIYSDMQNGKLDYVDGVFQKEINESILRANPNMVNYKYYDQGTVGLYYNLEKEIWDNELVREAFQYIFNREKLTELVNPYAITSWKPMMIMSPIEARMYMDLEVYNMINNYSYDLNKAEELLKQAGWKKANGKWYDSNSKYVEITLGYQNLGSFSKLSEAIKGELEQFGIGVILKNGNDMTTWFSTASTSNSIYDCVVAHTELNTFGTHPAGSMKHFFDTIQAHVLHLSLDKSDSKWAINVDLLDPTDPNISLGRVRIVDIYSKIYCYEGAQLKNYVNSIVLGFSKYNYGVPFYENVTGSYFDVSRVGGLPSSELFTGDRNIIFIPQPGDEEYNLYALTNVHFTQAAPVGNGYIYAR